MSLEGKSCIVTGAANGVGRSISRSFAEAGAKVMLADMDENRLAEEVETLSDRGYAVQQFTGDLSERLNVANLISATVDAYERIDVLVNGSRQIEMGDPMDTDPEQLNYLLEQNVTATLKICKAVAKRMIKQLEAEEDDTRRDCSIINLTSIATHRTIRDLGNYAISSAALDQLTRSLAVSLADRDIRVNGIAIGSVMSAWLRTNLKDDKDLRDRMITATPLGRIGDADEAASVARFLASADASFVTGQIITVDGGRTLIDPVNLPAY